MIAACLYSRFLPLEEKKKKKKFPVASNRLPTFNNRIQEEYDDQEPNDQ